MNNKNLNRLINLALLAGGSFLAFKSQSDPRFAWAIPLLQAINTELPAMGIVTTPPKK